MDQDISLFVDAIGAIEPKPGDEIYSKFKQIFRRSNYFIYEGHFLIIKISRSDRPFWGIGKAYVELLNGVSNYFLILLTSPTSGWLFSKHEVNHKIKNGDWPLKDKDREYKINPPSLRYENRFNLIEQFIEKIGVLLPKKISE
ncbi:hypothetical protein L0337_29230 [candidate division KSB1 bacterium]|nr:hypothetical protein [candidate division KSB1 bacterium]